jgi:hypothetical protein
LGLFSIFSLLYKPEQGEFIGPSAKAAPNIETKPTNQSPDEMTSVAILDNYPSRF